MYAHVLVRYNCQLCTLMIMGGFGEVHAVQQSLLETNTGWHMSKALDRFVRANPLTAKQLAVIMVDKGMNEIRVL